MLKTQKSRPSFKEQLSIRFIPCNNSNLTSLEMKVVSLIPNSDYRRITSKDLSQLTGLNKRDLYAVIETARRKGVPIVGDRSIRSAGYYIPVTEAARNHGIAALKSQLVELNKTLVSVSKADLHDWKMEVGGERELNEAKIEKIQAETKLLNTKQALLGNVQENTEKQLGSILDAITKSVDEEHKNE